MPATSDLHPVSHPRLPVEDPQWWEAIRSRDDAAAFDALYVTYRASLLRLASHFVDSPELATDIVHDVFAKLWLTRTQLVIRTNVGAYLARAVRNAALNACRRDAVARRHAQSATSDDETFASASDTADDDPREQLMQQIARALATLPARQREVADLRWHKGLDHTTIAHQLSIAPSTVNNLLTTAMRTIRAHIAAATSRRAS